MLTKEIILKNDQLKGLTDEQIASIEELSKNDENTVIGSRFSEVYTQLDATIERESGIKRDGSEKTYNYMARALKTLKENQASEEQKKEIQLKDAEISKLKEALTKGADERSQQLQAELSETKSKFNTLNDTMKELKKAHQKELFSLRVENELNNAVSGMRFKNEIPKVAIDALVSNATEKVKSFNPDYIDDGKGGKVLVFRNNEGAIMNNAENKLNPYTAKELLEEQLKDVLVVERQMAGAGSNGGSQTNTATIGGAKTRMEAMTIIEKDLLGRGLVRGTDEFQTAMDEAWKNNNVSSLPER